MKKIPQRNLPNEWRNFFNQQFKLSKADLGPEKEIAESPEDEAESDVEKPQAPINDHSVGRPTN